MRRRFLAVGAFALFCAGAAHATTQLLVSGATATGASATTIVDVKTAKEDAASAQVSIYVPVGYTVNLGQSAGTQIGTVTAHAQQLEISADAVTGLTGTILVADKGDSGIEAGAGRCTSTPVAHDAVWLLHFVVAGATMNVPVYVDSTSGAEATYSSAKLVFCLPQPYAKTLPEYSVSGTKLFDVKATLSAGVLTNPTSHGTFVWRTLVTPWALNGTAPNLAATSEAQGLVTVPAKLSLAAHVKTIRHEGHVTNSVLLSGRLLENLKGVSGARVSFFANGKSAGSTKTRAGAFSKTAGLAKRTRFSASATVPMRERSCVAPLPFATSPGGCVSATIAGYKLISPTVLVAPRKK